MTPDFIDAHLTRGELTNWETPPKIHFDLADTFFGAHEQRVRDALTLFQQHGYEMVAITNDDRARPELIAAINKTKTLPNNAFTLQYKFFMSSNRFFDVANAPKCELLFDNDPYFLNDRGHDDLLSKLYLSHIEPQAV